MWPSEHLLLQAINVVQHHQPASPTVPVDRIMISIAATVQMLKVKLIFAKWRSEQFVTGRRLLLLLLHLWLPLLLLLLLCHSF